MDAVCEFRGLTKLEKPQAQLKGMLEVEMRAYAHAHGMIKPLEEHRRCWRQPYADGAQFHIDVTPAVLSGEELTAMLKMRLMDTSLASTSISITATSIRAIASSRRIGRGRSHAVISNGS
ncbi:hypothetical protein [Bradyrhizobium sp. Leo170]|uniref:hypothetical protein n=1 Tax=Bradyrhizobium sp. Leo170 TaxID=1571199 RepID=UPI00102E78ED|nr:hypothetical protein [Bradyrhizobium sp. Leo170]